MLRETFHFVRDLVKDARILFEDYDRDIERRLAFLHEVEGFDRAEALIYDRQTSLALIPNPAAPMMDGYYYYGDAIIGLSDERGYDKNSVKRLSFPTI